MRTLRIGTRGSKLALWQAEWVRSRLIEAHADVNVELVPIKTSGDMILGVPLAKIGGKGLFVKEIENALLDGRVDLAVHSMKDVPTIIPPGLSVRSVTKREEPFDVVISRSGNGLKSLPRKARIGTSSLRRQAQLLHFRSDLIIVPIRGNLDTRLRKLEEQNLDAIILASAGLKRMGLGYRTTETISTEICLPAIGQGVLAIETRLDDQRVHERIDFLNDSETALAMEAERAFLKRLEGGCQVPIAAYARRVDGELEVEGMVASVDGKKMVRQAERDSSKEAETLGVRLAEKILSLGGDEILREIYSHGA
ncbi:MAG: hydroxymethylbilane synthase [Proteobacteria bacterium]|nr:hydroxymethylbilane synthase [Pseudomonadota bacterium]NIS69522.1 hydroxymethylbilane synthase [Pseudomonadota bacterium]